jgi:hypothetical protein
MLSVNLYLVSGVVWFILGGHELSRGNGKYVLWGAVLGTNA